MKINNYLKAFSIILLPFAASVHAVGTASSAKKHYILASAGYSYPHEKHSSSHEKRSDSAGLGTIGVGYMINDKLRADITANYRGKYKYQAAVVNGVESHSTESIAYMLSGYWHFSNLYKKSSNTNMSFSPYLMAGIGHANNIARNIKLRKTDTTISYVEKHSHNLAWQVGLGALFNVHESMDIDLLYKYVQLGKITSHNISTQGTLGSLAHPRALKGRLNTHEVSVGIYFKFN